MKILGVYAALNIAILAFQEFNWIAVPEEFTAIALTAIYSITVLTFAIPLGILIIKKQLKAKDLSLNFHFHPHPIKQTIKLVFLGYGLLFLAGILMTLLSVILPFNIPGFDPQEALPFLQGNTSTKVVGAIIVVIIAPIIEEIFFRGFLLQTFLKRYSFVPASIITAGIFAFLHFQFQTIAGIFLLSLILNYLYKKANYSVIPTIAFHMVNNCIAMLIFLALDHIPAF
ncbi:CPBP family intramembrane metalloprotease [Candidatus Peregrinibacteria bacterium]|jgi:membrane protease YdiL (CAAX protease family)|nr:CPBP family intramembrane metalloprotease [Candidatus Peregrinibacteria bacterium]